MARNVDLGVGVVVGFFGAVVLLWGLKCDGGGGHVNWGEDGLGERAQVLVEQFNLSKNQLQALVLILSSSERECLEKSRNIYARASLDGLSCILETICSEHKPSGGQQKWVSDAYIQRHCPVQDEYDLGNCIASLSQYKDMECAIQQDTTTSAIRKDAGYTKEHESTGTIVNNLSKHQSAILLPKLTLKIIAVLVGIVLTIVASVLYMKWQLVLHEKLSQPHNTQKRGKWRKKILLFFFKRKILVLGVLIGLAISAWVFVDMNNNVVSRRIQTLANMCDERARMLQDQFNVSMNHVHALAIMVSTFHHGKDPSAIDQKTFAEYTARTAFERPLMSGVAYALKVLHSQREQFEQQHGWRIKKMETENQSLVHDDYNLEKLAPSPVRDEYAPVVFSQETVSHIVSIDMMSGKEDRDNILRARTTGKGALTSPFKLLKSNHLGVVLTFAVYKSDIAPNATPQEHVQATLGYLGASMDVPSLVEKLLQQLASKQSIVVELYDTTSPSSPIKMYGSGFSSSDELHISNVDFGDPTRKHEMHCRYKHEPPLPLTAISTSAGVFLIISLLAYIFDVALNRIEKVEDDYRVMTELKVRAEAADIAKSQFLATVSHEIRTPMNGVLGMLQMLMDTELDATQQDFVITARSSGKALITLINEVLDRAKIESGRLELEAVPFDVRDIMDNVLSLFSDKSQEKGIELAVFVSDQVPDVLIGDPGRFRQIITNLVGNSMKFTERGHIFVSVHLVEEVKRTQKVIGEVSTEDAQVVENSKGTMPQNTLSGFRVVDKRRTLQNFRMFKLPIETTDAVNLLVTVEDTGIGIPKEAQSRIFTPFMQADSSTSRTYGGTGIGLSITKCLVELMSGEISFVSTPGIGSTFSFTAAFKEIRKNNIDIKRYCSEPTPSDFQGMRALIVDGRTIRAEISKYHLQRLGIHADVITTSESALSAVLEACDTSGKSNLNMVLVDKEAWGAGSGLAFPRPLIDVRQKGTLKPWQNSPKMFLLATSLTPSEVGSLKSAGYAASIRKPLRLSMVAACLRKTLGVGTPRQQGREQSVALKSLLTGKQILVVDDNAVNRKVAAGALKKYGALVTCVDSGKDAVAMLQPPHKFDACFMDVQMPEMDGFQATRLIRYAENKVNGMIETGEASVETYGHVAQWHIPILAMTADVIQATFEECLRCGMDGYVSKPFEEQQLYSAVAHFMESDGPDPQ